MSCLVFNSEQLSLIESAVGTPLWLQLQAREGGKAGTPV